MTTLPAPLAGLLRPILHPCIRRLGNYGWKQMQRGRLSPALRTLRCTRGIARWVGDRIIEGHALTSLGVLYTLAGDQPMRLAAARDVHEQALALFRAVDNWYGQATALSHLGEVHYKIGDKERALDAFRRSASLYHAAGLPAEEGEKLTVVAALYVELGAPEPARAMLAEKIRPIAAAVGRLDLPARVLVSLGAHQWEQGEPQAALPYFQEAAELHLQAGEWMGEYFALRSMAALCVELGQPAEAARLYRRALWACDHLSDRFVELYVQYDLAKTLYSGLGQVNEATLVLRGVIARLERHGINRQANNPLGQMRAELARMCAGQPLTPPPDAPAQSPSEPAGQ